MIARTTDHQKPASSLAVLNAGRSIEWSRNPRCRSPSIGTPELSARVKQLGQRPEEPRVTDGLGSNRVWKSQRNRIGITRSTERRNCK
jgi:hypothetical protein